MSDSSDFAADAQAKIDAGAANDAAKLGDYLDANVSVSTGPTGGTGPTGPTGPTGAGA